MRFFQLKKAQYCFRTVHLILNMNFQFIKSLLWEDLVFEYSISLAV